MDNGKIIICSLFRLAKWQKNEAKPKKNELINTEKKTILHFVHLRSISAYSVGVESFLNVSPRID